MTILRWLLFFSCFSLHFPLVAESTVVISLINNSSSTFVFKRADVQFPNNTLAIEPGTLRPGDTASVSGTTTLEYDLSGVMYFSGGAAFWIVDKRQYHVGPPIFSFNTNGTVSLVISKTPNPKVGAKLLSYIAAKVLIKDK